MTLLDAARSTGRFSITILCIDSEARPRERSYRGRVCLQAKKPLPSGSYERRVPKIQ